MRCRRHMLRFSDWLYVCPIARWGPRVCVHWHCALKWNTYTKAPDLFSAVICELVWPCQDKDTQTFGSKAYWCCSSWVSSMKNKCRPEDISGKKQRTGVSVVAFHTFILIIYNIYNILQLWFSLKSSDIGLSTIYILCIFKNSVYFQQTMRFLVSHCFHAEKE